MTQYKPEAIRDLKPLPTSVLPPGEHVWVSVYVIPTNSKEHWIIWNLWKTPDSHRKSNHSFPGPCPIPPKKFTIHNFSCLAYNWMTARYSLIVGGNQTAFIPRGKQYYAGSENCAYQRLEFLENTNNKYSLLLVKKATLNLNPILVSHTTDTEIFYHV